MPSLRDMKGTSLPGFVPFNPEIPKDPPPVMGTRPPNPIIRCPLPPFNVNTDTLRQFDEETLPTRRVIPLPIQTGNATTTKITNNTTVINQSSGSSSSSVAALATKVVTYTSPLLLPGAADYQTLTMAKSFQLISMIANSPCEIRLYGNIGSQSIDASRPTDAPLSAEGQHDLMTDIVFDTSPFGWTWQNRVGVNSDTTQSSNIYITCINTTASPISVSATIVFLPLET